MRGVRGLGLLLLGVASAAWAGGPRFVTGTSGYSVRAGTPMAWYTGQPLYFTDPGARNSPRSP